MKNNGAWARFTVGKSSGGGGGGLGDGLAAAVGAWGGVRGV